MKARTISIRGIPNATLELLRVAARRQRRSLNAELLTILERAAQEAQAVPAPRGIRETAALPYYPKGGSSGSVSEVDRTALAGVCRRFHIQSLMLFGSAARGEAVPGGGSDVDLLAEFEPGMTPGFGIVTAAEALARVFGRPVDLLTRRGLSSRVRRRVLAEAVPLYHA